MFQEISSEGVCFIKETLGKKALRFGMRDVRNEELMFAERDINKLRHDELIRNRVYGSL